MSASDGHAVSVHRFRSQVIRRGDGRWDETAPASCPAGHSLTEPRSMLVGWDSSLDPPHRVWICQRCGLVTHNLGPVEPIAPMRPVRLDHCHPHRDPPAPAVRESRCNAVDNHASETGDGR